MGIGSLDNPYVETWFAGRIINVHWKNKGIVCGGSAVADGQGPYPYNGVFRYVGTGDLEQVSPSNLFAGACRSGQPWTIDATVILDMTLGPLQPDGFDPTLPNLNTGTQDATYNASYKLWTLEGSTLGVLLAETSLSGSVHNDAIMSPYGAGTTVYDRATGSLSASGTGPVVFAFTWSFSTAPSVSTARGSNVGGGPTIGHCSVRDFP